MFDQIADSVSSVTKPSHTQHPTRNELADLINQENIAVPSRHSLAQHKGFSFFFVLSSAATEIQ